MKYKKNRMKQIGEISWMLFAMSIVSIGLLLEGFQKKLKFKKA